VYVTIATLPGAGEGIGLGIRYADVGTNGVDGYNIYYEQASGTDTVIIMRLDDGSDTQLGATISQDFSAGDGIGVEAISSQIIVYRRSSGTWSDISSGGRTDGTYTSAGYISLEASANAFRLDDFGGGTVVAIEQASLGLARILAQSLQGIATAGGSESLSRVLGDTEAGGAVTGGTLALAETLAQSLQGIAIATGASMLLSVLGESAGAEAQIGSA